MFNPSNNPNHCIIVYERISLALQITQIIYCIMVYERISLALKITNIIVLLYMKE